MLLDAKREPAWSARDQSQPGAVRSFELPDACVARMHDLCWRPGDYMYASWWSALGLAEWHDTYRKLPACRASIDRVIVSRRGFPVAPLNSDIDDEGRRLLAMEPRLPALCAALGLIALDCDEHLLLGACAPSSACLAAINCSRSTLDAPTAERVSEYRSSVSPKNRLPPVCAGLRGSAPHARYGARLRFFCPSSIRLWATQAECSNATFQARPQRYFV